MRPFHRPCESPSRGARQSATRAWLASVLSQSDVGARRRGGAARQVGDAHGRSAEVGSQRTIYVVVRARARETMRNLLLECAEDHTTPGPTEPNRSAPRGTRQCTLADTLAA